MHIYENVHRNMCISVIMINIKIEQKSMKNTLKITVFWCQSFSIPGPLCSLPNICKACILYIGACLRHYCLTSDPALFSSSKESNSRWYNKPLGLSTYVRGIERSWGSWFLPLISPGHCRHSESEVADEKSLFWSLLSKSQIHK